MIDEFEFEFDFCKVNEFEFDFCKVNEFEFEFKNYKKNEWIQPCSRVLFTRSAERVRAFFATIRIVRSGLLNFLRRRRKEDAKNTLSIIA